MKAKLWLAGAVVAASLVGVHHIARADDTKKSDGFGALESISADDAKAKSLAWLKKATNNDAAKITQFNALWARTDRSVLDNVADTFALGNADAASLLTKVRNPNAPALIEVPSILTDAKQDVFFRANLGLAVARHLSLRRVHEEALLILGSFNAEQTIDPSAYLFHRAVAEHALLKKDDANKTISRLINDAVDSPDRYKTVAALMMLDMQTWKKDLANVARLMDNSGRRLELDRIGPQTQKIQKEVIARLDELIRELENKAKKKGGGGGGGGGGKDPNDGSCPDGSADGPGKGGLNPKKPAPDSAILGGSGSGRVDPAQIAKKLEGWGKMDPGERKKVEQELGELIDSLPALHRDAFERYFDELRQQALPSNKK